MRIYDIELDDPRVVAVARERQQLAHEHAYLSTWGELSEDDRALCLPQARIFLVAAIRAGLVAAATAGDPSGSVAGEGTGGDAGSASLRRMADLARTEWPLVRAHLGCACTDADPARCTGSPEPSGTPRCGPAPGHRQCSCHHVRTVEEHAAIRAAGDTAQLP